MKIKLGVSSCLLGEEVRYDAGHKHNTYINKTLATYFDFISVCPEVGCGLPIPRPAMRLIGDSLNPRLITTHTKEDYTDQMKVFCQNKVKELAQEDLCGFIFKKDSPSSGLYRVKIYSENGTSVRSGRGIFARYFTEEYPLLPIEEEGRLSDPDLRENFIESVFYYRRWKDFLQDEPSIAKLMDFHAQHKLLFMSHSPEFLRQLGRLTANAFSRNDLNQVLKEYEEISMKAMRLQATVKKHVNVLMHIMGYFKKELTSDEKKELLSIIDQYHQSFVPLIVPLTLLKHYVRKFNEPYLIKQIYLNPHPSELMLRNHV